MGKYYINQYIKNIAKRDSGESDQVETDPTKIYLNKLATKTIQKGISYADIFNPQSGSSVIIIAKGAHTNEFSDIQINSENKIGDENNYKFIIVEFPDDADFSSPENLKTIFENSKYIFVDEENTVYFLNKFIKVSTKQFMKSVLYSMDFGNANTTIFNGLDINAKNFEDNIAINNFKFVMPVDQENVQYIVLDDIDLEAFYALGNRVECIFYENENKLIFRANSYKYGSSSKYNSVEFVFSNNPNYEIITANVNGINFKSLEIRSGGLG